MSADSLKVIQNKDKTFTLEWDKNDPNWDLVEWVDRRTNSDYYETSDSRLSQ